MYLVACEYFRVLMVYCILLDFGCLVSFNIFGYFVGVLWIAGLGGFW